VKAGIVEILFLELKAAIKWKAHFQTKGTLVLVLPTAETVSYVAPQWPECGT
jgi:hypothetical protein